MKKLVAIVLAGLLLVPVLAGQAQAWGGGARGGWHGGGGGWHGGGGGWHGGGWGGGCCWGGWGWSGFAAGVGVGALATAPYWYGPAYAYPAYSYPAYGYPAYSYPAYSYPTYPPPSYVPPADPGAMTQPSQSMSVTPGTPPWSPPSVQGSPPAGPTGSQKCETVTIEGHYETRTLQSGQNVTAWVPTHMQQICQ